jgi:AcrR family transcriptional regulator
MPAAPAARPRRTQADRRAATLAALLDAGVEVLVEEGQAALTTRRVAARADVSQGTVMHYFPQRRDLIGAVVRRATDVVLAELSAVGASEASATPGHRFAAMLDEVWELHNSPVHQAVMELWAAGHRDESVAQAVREAAHELNARAYGLASEFFPGFADTPPGAQLLDEIQVLARGCAFDTLIADREEADRRWRGVRDGLIARFTAIDDALHHQEESP